MKIPFHLSVKGDGKYQIRIVHEGGGGGERFGKGVTSPGIDNHT